MSGVATTMFRPVGDRVILGVCAAVARRIELDVTLVRILAGIGLIVFTVPFLIAYAGLALVVPREDGRMLLGGEPRDRRESLIGWALVLVAAGLVIASPALFGIGDGFGVFQIGVLLIGASVIAVAVSRSRPRGHGPTAHADAAGEDAPEGPAPAPAAATAVTEKLDRDGAAGAQPPGSAETTENLPSAGPAAPGAPKPPKPPSVFAPVFGAITALLGLGAVVVAVFDISLTPVAVAVVAGAFAAGCGGVAIATYGRRGTFPLLALGALLALVAATAAVGRDEFDRGVGFRELEPLSAGEVEAGYDFGIGAMEIDLRSVELPPGRTTMPVKIGFGFAEVIVPADLQIVATGDSINGELPVEPSPPAADQEASASGEARGSGGESGAGRESGSGRVAGEEPPVLVVDAEIGAGTVEISRRGGG